jgi:hypothetical protein
MQATRNEAEQELRLLKQRVLEAIDDMNSELEKLSKEGNIAYADKTSLKVKSLEERFSSLDAKVEQLRTCCLC